MPERPRRWGYLGCLPWSIIGIAVVIWLGWTAVAVFHLITRTMSDDLLAGVVGDQVMLDQDRWIVLEVGHSGVVRRDQLKVDERSRALLEKLGAWKGVDPDVITDAWGSPVVIRRTQDGVDVIRIGSDRLLDTGNDRVSSRRLETRKP